MITIEKDSSPGAVRYIIIGCFGENTFYLFALTMKIYPIIFLLCREKINNPNYFIRAGQIIIKITFYHNRKKKGIPMAGEYLYSVGSGITFLRLWIGKMEFPVQSTGNCFLTDK